MIYRQLISTSLRLMICDQTLERKFLQTLVSISLRQTLKRELSVSKIKQNNFVVYREDILG